jgi:hypothetical protein
VSVTPKMINKKGKDDFALEDAEASAGAPSQHLHHVTGDIANLVSGERGPERRHIVSAHGHRLNCGPDIPDSVEGRSRRHARPCRPHHGRSRRPAHRVAGLRRCWHAPHQAPRPLRPPPDRRLPLFVGQLGVGGAVSLPAEKSCSLPRLGCAWPEVASSAASAADRAAKKNNRMTSIREDNPGRSTIRAIFGQR